MTCPNPLLKLIRSVIVLCILSGISYPAQSQSPNHIADSLEKLLPRAKDDSTRIQLYGQLGLIYQSVDANKAIQNLKEAYKLAKLHKYTREMTFAIASLAYFYSQTGESAKTIEMCQETLRTIEETKGDPSMVLSFMGMGYEAQGDLKNAIEYARRSYLIFEERIKEPLAAHLKDPTVPFDNTGYVAAPTRMGILFEKMNILDSALYYVQISYNRALKFPVPFFFCQTCNVLGKVHSRLNHPDEAFKYYKFALSSAQEANYPASIQESQIGLANFYYKINKPDSVIHYATEAYDGAINLKNYGIMEEAARLLRKAFEMKGDYAKAIFYNDLSVAARDSVSGADKVREVQNLTYKEERREEKIKQEIEANKIAYQNKIKMYSLLAILGGVLLLAIVLYRNYRQKNKANKVLGKKNLVISQEKKRSDDLLLNILPTEVAEELKANGATKAKDFSEVTVLFTDFKNFTLMTEQLSAQELVNEINYCYSAFDNIVTKYGIEKIKTIGDSYMCAGGLPVVSETNAEDTVKAALEIRDFMLSENKKRESQNKPFFEIRIGCNTGPVVAGIVGIKKFAYDIWGDTVNIASRMESSGEPGKVNISGSTYELVKDKFTCNHRGKIEAKNKGTIDMYFVET